MQRATLRDLSDVTAVVLNWNTAPDCVGLLHSMEQDFEQGLRFVLVDNGECLPCSLLSVATCYQILTRSRNFSKLYAS